jgi:uncharacterized protein YbjT (DUF2867 family)
MATATKKVATALAKTLNELDVADWQARDWRDMQRQIRAIRDQVSRLFTSTGYEYGENPKRVRIRRNA